MVDVDSNTLMTNEPASASMESIPESQGQTVIEKRSSIVESPDNSSQNIPSGNTARSGGLVSNLSSSTVTIVRERLKPLILKLRHPQYSLLGLGSAVMPKNDVQQTVDELGEELIVSMMEAINTIRDEVKRARPLSDEEDYEVKIVAYQELLAYITEMMKKLTKTLCESLSEFRARIDRLWEDIQRAQTDDQVQDHVQQFTRHTEELFKQAMSQDIQPFLQVIEAKLNIGK